MFNEIKITIPFDYAALAEQHDMPVDKFRRLALRAADGMTTEEKITLAFKMGGKAHVLRRMLSNRIITPRQRDNLMLMKRNQCMQVVLEILADYDVKIGRA